MTTTLNNALFPGSVFGAVGCDVGLLKSGCADPLSLGASEDEDDGLEVGSGDEYVLGDEYPPVEE